MNYEEIKVGETYYVRVKVDSKDSEGVYCQLIDADCNGRKAHHFYKWMLYAFTPVHAAPKYDPCRRFKKGDKVRVKNWNGRTTMRDGRDGFVVKDEENGGMVELDIDGYRNGVFYHACMLELVTPVEELEPLYLDKVSTDGDTRFLIKTKKDEKIVRVFCANDFESITQTEVDALAALRNLNEKARKEQNNG